MCVCVHASRISRCTEAAKQKQMLGMRDGVSHMLYLYCTCQCCVCAFPDPAMATLAMELNLRKGTLEY